MNSRQPMVVQAWSADLEASRDVNERQRDAFGMILGWSENWQMRTGCEPDRESCKRFWREQVKSKERKDWQPERWAEAMRWHERWLAVGIYRGAAKVAKERGGR